MGGVEISVPLQFIFYPFVFGLQRTDALRKQALDDKRQDAAFFVHVDRANDDDMIAFADAVHHPSGTIAE